MLKKRASIFVCGVLGSILSFSANAVPISSAPAKVVVPDVVLVRGFCGPGFHRGLYGYCLRNGTNYVYVPPPVALPGVCPWGYYMGPYGRCYAY